MDELATPKDQESWDDLLNAASIRKGEHVLRYKDCGSFQEIHYHSECRKKFVHKKTLKRLKREPEATSSKDEESVTLSRRSSGNGEMGLGR